MSFYDYELVSFPVEESLAQVIREAQDALFIAAPYIKDYGINIILDNARINNLRVLTNLDLPNVTSAGFDLGALLKLWSRFNLRVSSLGKLHAKASLSHPCPSDRDKQGTQLLPCKFDLFWDAGAKSRLKCTLPTIELH